LLSCRITRSADALATGLRSNARQWLAGGSPPLGQQLFLDLVSKDLADDPGLIDTAIAKANCVAGHERCADDEDEEDDPDHAGAPRNRASPACTTPLCSSARAFRFSEDR